MRNRVVVTGLGCITPLGNDVRSSWENCINGNSGIEKITNFNPEMYRCQIAGEVKNFLLPEIMTLAPFSENNSAVVFPIPEVPPVTKTTLLSNSLI